MVRITIRHYEKGDLRVQSIFDQMERRREAVRSRAFELFEMRGGEPGHAVEDWLKAEREVLGWPPLETQESDSEFEFHVPLDDFQISQVELIVTPSEIVVHARAKEEAAAAEPNARPRPCVPQHVYRRIALPQPIRADRTKATLNQGTLRITAAKAPVLLRQAVTAGD